MIAEIENAMIARIQAASDTDTLGYRLRKVTSYGGEFDEDINKAVKQFPAVWFAWVRNDEPEQVDTAAYQYKPVFSAMCATRSRRNEAATRKSATASETGSYQILKDVRGLLVGQTLGLEILPIAPGPARTLFSGETRAGQLSILVQDFKTEFADAATDISALNDFSSFHVDWDIPILGEGPQGTFTPGGPPLPAGEPDAEDNVTGLESA